MNTATATRPFRGGRVFDGASDLPDASAPRTRTYPCFADQCPMVGAIFTGDTNAVGACGYHYGANPGDIPRITQVLKDWGVVIDEIREGRRMLTGSLAVDAKAVSTMFSAAWHRLQPMVAGWENELRPSTIHHIDKHGQAVDTGWTESYSDWVRRLERFMGARIRETIGSKRK